MIIDTGRGKMPVRYGWNALAKFGDLTGMSMDEVLKMNLKKMKISDVLIFIYVGFTEGAKKEGEECKVKDVDDVGDLIDSEPDLISKVMEAFSEMGKTEGTGDKKK